MQGQEQSRKRTKDMIAGIEPVGKEIEMFNLEAYQNEYDNYAEYMEYLKDLANRAYAVEFEAINMIPEHCQYTMQFNTGKGELIEKEIHEKPTLEGIEACVLATAREENIKWIEAVEKNEL